MWSRHRSWRVVNETVAILSDQQRLQLERARIAAVRDQSAYVLDLTRDLLRDRPECCAVRQLRYQAQVKKFAARRGVLQRVRAFVGVLALRAWSAKSERELLCRIDALLLLDPRSVPLLAMQARLARKCQWPHTEIWTREAIRSLRPGDEANLLALGEALLTASQADRALAVADDLLRRHPVSRSALELQRHAAIAQTIREGNWESSENFRHKLRQPPGPVTDAPPARLPVP